jgi:protocatechuate 3,4-dioxygenase beta subunit
MPSRPTRDPAAAATPAALTPAHPSDPPSAPARRHALRLAGGAALIAMPALWLGPRAQTARLRPTPAQAEGPYYPVHLPADSDFDLLRNGSAAPYRGTVAWVEGQVSDTQGRPLAGAVVEIWQCDADGHYHHPGDGGLADPAFQGYGRVSAGADGRYRFRTLRPAPYSGRTPHIHVKVGLGGRERLTTQLYVRGDPGNARDGLWRSLRDERDRDALTVAFEPGGPERDGLRAQFPIVIAT